MPPVTQAKAQTITGKILGVNISPKGDYESLLLEANKKIVQINFSKHSDHYTNDRFHAGKNCTITARPMKDERPSAHKVYELIEDHDEAINEGIIARINYARHGEPNGVILDTGEFIHMKPEGTHGLKLAIGKKITFAGERKTAPHGQVVVEAKTVNGKKIIRDKPAKKHK